MSANIEPLFLLSTVYLPILVSWFPPFPPKIPPCISSVSISGISQGHASQSGYDIIGRFNPLKLNLVNIGDTFIANIVAATAKTIATIAYNAIKPTAGNATTAAIPYCIAKYNKRAGITIAITHFKIGHTSATKCRIGIIGTNIRVNIVITILNKKNIRSKFLTPSFTGNLFVVVVHPLSVISFIPKCLLLLYPHFHLSKKLAIV